MINDTRMQSQTLQLRPLQELAVKIFAQGNDVFMKLPTGSGKSACFCIIPPLFDALRNEPGSIAIMVSPLVALMKDQVEAMKKRGISVVYVGDSSGVISLQRFAQEHFKRST